MRGGKIHQGRHVVRTCSKKIIHPQIRRSCSTTEPACRPAAAVVVEMEVSQPSEDPWQAAVAHPKLGGHGEMVYG
eukprot:5531465-Pleurochrysis_carterae.AAC.1